MSGAGAGVRACRTGRRGQRGGEGECREALQDPAARLCPAAGTVQPLGFGEGVPPNPSRQLRTHGAGSAAGRRGVRGRRLHSPAEAGKGGGSAGAPTRALAAPPGRRPCPRGSPAEPDGAGSPSRRAWGAQREAACRPRRLAPVPTSLVSHGWSEVLFLKRLQGGLKQPPTSLPERAVDCQPCSGQGTRAVHLAAGRMGPPGWRLGAGGAPTPKPEAGGPPLLLGTGGSGPEGWGVSLPSYSERWLIRAPRGGESCGMVDIRELPQASRRPGGL